MSVSGGPSRPTIVLLDGAALAGSGVVSGTVNCAGARWALIEWSIGSADAVTIDIFGGGPIDDAAPGFLYEGNTRLTLASLGAGGAGRSMLVQLGGVVGTLKPQITNTTANATTATLAVTLGY